MILHDVSTIVHAVSEINSNSNLGLKAKDAELPYSHYAMESKHYCLVLLTTALDVCHESMAMSDADYRAIREKIFDAKSIEAAFDNQFYDEPTER